MPQGSGGMNEFVQFEKKVEKNKKRSGSYEELLQSWRATQQDLGGDKEKQRNTMNYSG